MERYVCIHGHFYQPPRENAWLEFVEQQDSAYAGGPGGGSTGSDGGGDGG